MSEAHIDLQLLLQNRSCNVNKEAMLKVFALIARTVITFEKCVRNPRNVHVEGVQ